MIEPILKPFKTHNRTASGHNRNRVTQWFGTIWKRSDYEMILKNKEDCHYMIFSDKDHTKDGQEHWHCYLKAKKQYYGSHWGTETTHWEPVRNAQWAIGYCKKKGENFQEIGEYIEEGGTTEAWRGFVEECKKSTPRQLIDGAYSKLYARYTGFAGIVNTTFRKCEIQDGELRNEWYWGPRGTGKTSKAWRENPNIFVKAINKWWDGYADEKVVLLDDWDPDIKGMVNYLKIWSDRYPFRAEVKGSSMMIRPKKIIVTSNYPIEECFERQQDVEALRRRFRVTQFHKSLQQED